MYCFFVFELETRTGRTDGETDGRGGKSRNAAT